MGRILVVSDNSTDPTITIADAVGVEVLEAEANSARKAGALNQALDTVERALEELENPAVGGGAADGHADARDDHLGADPPDAQAHRRKLK